MVNTVKTSQKYFFIQSSTTNNTMLKRASEQTRERAGGISSFFFANHVFFRELVPTSFQKKTSNFNAIPMKPPINRLLATTQLFWDKNISYQRTGGEMVGVYEKVSQGKAFENQKKLAIRYNCRKFKKSKKSNFPDILIP